MPFDNSYYNDLSTKMRNLEIKEQTIEPIEIVFDEELFLKSKGTPINYYTQDICQRLGLSLDLYKKREKHVVNKDYARDGAANDNKRSYQQTKQQFHYVPKKQQKKDENEIDLNDF